MERRMSLEGPDEIEPVELDNCRHCTGRVPGLVCHWAVRDGPHLVRLRPGLASACHRPVTPLG